MTGNPHQVTLHVDSGWLWSSSKYFTVTLLTQPCRPHVILCQLTWQLLAVMLTHMSHLSTPMHAIDNLAGTPQYGFARGRHATEALAYGSA
jgi:hypothetical protein